MDLTQTSRAELNNGIEIPVLGLGVYGCPPGRPTQEAVAFALGCGYRHVDTAKIYRNEADVGEAVRASPLPREEVFITTKLWNDDHGYEAALRAFEGSLKTLGLEYIDLYLIHWPVKGLRAESWRALATLLERGRTRAIGVSNYTIRHLEELLAASPIPPAVNQVEFSPFLYQEELLDYCRRHGIQLEAYSPLTKGRRLGDPTLVEVARKHHRTPSQVLIRWALQHGLVVIPKSQRLEHIRENFSVFDFSLSPADMAQLDGLSEDYRTSWDPSDVQ
jgi:diketogulonate reductase-like aldo/keto reductase